MTTYTFKPKSSTNQVNWNDPTIWVGGVVPNAADADVDFPVVTLAGTDTPYQSYVSILTSESFATRSIDLRDTLRINGTLTVSGALTQYSGGAIEMLGGHLTAGSIVNNASISAIGTIDVGTLANNTQIATNGALAINATQVTNLGTLLGAGSSALLTLTVGAGGITGLSNGTLSAGQLYDGVRIDAGTLITTDASSITLSGKTIESRDPVGGAWVAITQSLHSIAAASLLTIEKGHYQFDQLAIAGTVKLLVPSNNTPDIQFGANALSITPTGTVIGGGIITSDIVNDGLVRVDLGQQNGPWKLTVNGAVTGTGHLEIAAGHLPVSVFDKNYSLQLELNGATAQTVVFANNVGTLALDQPSSFTGTIQTSGSGDHVVLAGVGLSAVTNVSYAGDTTGGTLTLQTASGSTALHFAGYHSVGNFALAAGPQFLSTDPPSLDIRVAANVAGHVSDFNTDGFSDILWRNVDGRVGDWYGTGGFAVNPTLYSASTDWQIAGTGDFNGDGRADILWRNANTGTVGDWLSGPGGGFAPNPFVYAAPSDWKIVGTGDFNGDGRTDILWRNPTSIGVWNGIADGTFWVDPRFLTVSTSSVVAGTGDFNGDGFSDFLLRATDGKISIGFGSTNPSTIPVRMGATSFDAPLNWHVAETGDFTGDGLSDILWRSDTGQIGIWTSDAAGNFTANATLYSVTGDWKIVDVGDYNNDGKDDILWRNTNTGQVGDWLSGGNGSFTPNATLYAAPADWTIFSDHPFLI